MHAEDVEVKPSIHMEAVASVVLQYVHIPKLRLVEPNALMARQ